MVMILLSNEIGFSIFDSISFAFIFEGSLAFSPFNGELVFSGNGRHFMPLLSSLEFQMASNVPSSFDKMSDTTYFFYLLIIFSSSMQLLKMKLSDGFLIFFRAMYFTSNQ